jgi:hypothetical protein
MVDGYDTMMISFLAPLLSAQCLDAIEEALDV